MDAFQSARHPLPCCGDRPSSQGNVYPSHPDGSTSATPLVWLHPSLHCTALQPSAHGDNAELSMKLNTPPDASCHSRSCAAPRRRAGDYVGCDGNVRISSNSSSGEGNMYTDIASMGHRRSSSSSGTSSTGSICTPVQVTSPPCEELQGTCVLLVLTGGRGRSRLLHSIKATGVRIVCFNPTVNWAEEYVAQGDWILGSAGDEEAAVQAVDEHLARVPGTINGVLCYDEYGLPLAARLAQHLGLPHLAPEAMACLRSKVRFREACTRAGLPAARFMALDSEFGVEEERKFHELDIRFPVVVKPAACAGSFSVMRANSMSELRRMVDRCRTDVSSYLQKYGLLPVQPVQAVQTAQPYIHVAVQVVPLDASRQLQLAGSYGSSATEGSSSSGGGRGSCGNSSSCHHSRSTTMSTAGSSSSIASSDAECTICQAHLITGFLSEPFPHSSSIASSSIDLLTPRVDLAASYSPSSHAPSLLSVPLKPTVEDLPRVDIRPAGTQTWDPQDAPAAASQTLTPRVHIRPAATCVPEDLPTAAANSRAAGAGSFWHAQGGAGCVLVEEMLQGHEVDVDCVVYRGELIFACVSDNHPTGSNGAFLETGCTCPSVLPGHAQAALLELTRQVVSELCPNMSGCLHFEAMCTADGPVPIELNARIGGAETPTNVLTAWGVDLGIQALRACLGLPPNIRAVAGPGGDASTLADGQKGLHLGEELATQLLPGPQRLAESVQVPTYAPAPVAPAAVAPPAAAAPAGQGVAAAAGGAVLLPVPTAEPATTANMSAAEADGTAVVTTAAACCSCCCCGPATEAAAAAIVPYLGTPQPSVTLAASHKHECEPSDGVALWLDTLPVIPGLGSIPVTSSYGGQDVDQGMAAATDCCGDPGHQPLPAASPFTTSAESREVTSTPTSSSLLPPAPTTAATAASTPAAAMATAPPLKSLDEQAGGLPTRPAAAAGCSCPCCRPASAPGNLPYPARIRRHGVESAAAHWCACRCSIGTRRGRCACVDCRCGSSAAAAKAGGEAPALPTPPAPAPEMRPAGASSMDVLATLVPELSDQPPAGAEHTLNRLKAGEAPLGATVDAATPRSAGVTVAPAELCCFPGCMLVTSDVVHAPTPSLTSTVTHTAGTTQGNSITTSTDQAPPRPAAAAALPKLPPPPTSPLVPALPHTHLYSINFVPEWEGAGEVASITLPDSVTQDPAFVDLEIYYQPGDPVQLPPLGFSNLGWLVVRGNTALEAEAAMSRLSPQIKIVLRKPSEVV